MIYSFRRFWQAAAMKRRLRRPGIHPQIEFRNGRYVVVESGVVVFEKLTVDLNQGTRDGEKVGYVSDGQGGYFFESKRTLKETLNSLEADEVDKPLFSLDEARRALRAVLRRQAKYFR